MQHESSLARFLRHETLALHCGNAINYGKQHIILASAVSCVDVRQLTLSHVDTSPYVHVCACGLRRLTQGLCKVQNTPLIRHKPFHVTNSIHVIGHLLQTLHSLRYMLCVACVRLEAKLNAGCQLREDVEWAKCRSNTACVERCDSVLLHQLAEYPDVLHTVAAFATHHVRRAVLDGRGDVGMVYT